MLFVFLAALTAPAFAGNSCVNRDQNDPYNDVYHSSVFLHGFRHGYEAGFYQADLELHLAHPLKDARQYQTFRDVPCKDDNRDRGLYDDGFRAGFVVGMQDMGANRDFRVLTLLAGARADLTPSAAMDHQFDYGVSQGYLVASGGTRHLASKMLSKCTTNAQSGFCAGVRTGRTLGNMTLSDGTKSAALHQAP